MTLEELYDEKLKLESEIYAALYKFKDKTGLLPNKIDLDISTLKYASGGTHSILNNVTVNVEL